MDLWDHTTIHYFPCVDKRAIECFRVKFHDYERIRGAKSLQIWGLDFGDNGGGSFNLKSIGTIKGVTLMNFESNNREIFGYITFLSHDTKLWGFLEYNGARYTIEDNNSDNKEKGE